MFLNQLKNKFCTNELIMDKKNRFKYNVIYVKKVF